MTFYCTVSKRCVMQTFTWVWKSKGPLSKMEFLPLGGGLCMVPRPGHHYLALHKVSE